MPVTAYKSPGTAANADRDGKEYWTNPNYAKLNDENYAQCIVAKSDYGDWLRLTNFGFALGDIPSGSTIDGIEVQYYKYELPPEVNDIVDSVVKLRKSTGQVGDNYADATFWPAMQGIFTYGGAADDWNAGLVDTDIRASTFGVDISALNTDSTGGRYACIFYCRIRVYYTIPAAEDHRRASFFKMF